MLKITRQTDFAIMLLARMTALPEGATLNAREAARWSGLSLPMVSKILKLLARRHLITSHRGANGGYRTVRSLDQISVADIVRALEGPISIVTCGAHPGTCEQESICPTRLNWARINREVEQALDRMPVAEMLLPAPEPLLRVETSPQAGRA